MAVFRWRVRIFLSALILKGMWLPSVPGSSPELPFPFNLPSLWRPEKESGSRNSAYHLPASLTRGALRSADPVRFTGSLSLGLENDDRIGIEKQDLLYQRHRRVSAQGANQYSQQHGFREPQPVLLSDRGKRASNRHRISPAQHPGLHLSGRPALRVHLGEYPGHLCHQPRKYCHPADYGTVYL